MSDLLTLGAAQLVNEIRFGNVTPLEAVDAHIERIEAVNPAINALVTPMFDQAREQGRIATDHARKNRDDLPPLFGLPVTIKDELAVKGVRLTAGSARYRNHIAERDAESVRRLRAAGAIILGKTNCTELGASVETGNPIFGLTRNPWNVERSAGGSTGGEGALIAAGGSPLGIGADIGGSIRIPSALCGIVGLKPTSGRISADGHLPDPPPRMAAWLTAGPMARRVEDIALALSVLSKTPVTPHTDVPLRGRRVVVPRFLPVPSVSRDIAAGIRDATGVLAGAGMELEEGRKLPILRSVAETAVVMYREWLPALRTDLGGGKPVNLFTEVLALVLGKGRVTSSVLAGLTALRCIFGPLALLLRYPRSNGLEAIRSEILSAMGPGGLLLTPVLSTTARPHGFAWTPAGVPFYTVIFSSLGFPAVAVPVGISKEALPVSVQLIGCPGEDETVLAAASVVEKAFGGWRMAPLKRL